MATRTIPRLSPSQRTVLAELPEPSGKNKRSYDKLRDLGLVHQVDEGFERRDDGDELLLVLRAEGLVPEAEDTETSVTIPDDTPDGTVVATGRIAEPVEEPAATAEAKPKPKAKTPSTKNPNKPDPTGKAKRTCKYQGHKGKNPLPATEKHFPVRGGTGERAGTFVGWCHACQKQYRIDKKAGTFVATQTRSASVAAEPVVIPEPPENLTDLTAGFENGNGASAS